MTLFSLTPLVFLVPYVWDGAARIVKRALRAGGVEALGALTERGATARLATAARGLLHEGLATSPRSLSARSARTKSATKVFAALSGEETSAAVSSPGTVAVSVADGCLPAEQTAVPDLWKAVA